MVTVLAVVGVLLVLFAAAVVATRGDAGLAPAPADAADVVRPTTADDVRRVRFSLALRGYRMAEVDDVLDGLAEQLAVRDARIAELGGAAGGLTAPGGAPGGLAVPGGVPGGLTAAGGLTAGGLAAPDAHPVRSDADRAQEAAGPAAP